MVPSLLTGVQKMAQQQSPMGPPVIALDTLPRDALCHITSYLHGHELLGLRCQSTHCRDAIRYAAGSHVGCSRVQLRSERSMEARMLVARAFGHACRHLEWSTTPNQAVSNGQSLPRDDFLVEWCRTAPNLVSLNASQWVCISMERAAAIGSACPLLEDVKFSGWDEVSPAETWAKCFPKLRQVNLKPDRSGALTDDYVPTDLAAISETLRVCTSAVELYCDQCQITRPVVDLFIGTPFGNRLRALKFTGSQVAADDLLACARGFPQLRALALPANELGDVSFYEVLARARPELAYLAFSWSETTEDRHIAAACSVLSLRCLVVDDCDQCGDDPRLIDGILGSSTAASLEEIEISKTDRGLDLGGEHILRLVRGCPRLRVFADFYDYQGESDEDADEAREILRHRGGDAISPHYPDYPHEGNRYTLWSDAWKHPPEVRFTKFSTPAHLTPPRIPGRNFH